MAASSDRALPTSLISAFLPVRTNIAVTACRPPLADKVPAVGHGRGGPYPLDGTDDVHTASRAEATIDFTLHSRCFASRV